MATFRTLGVALIIAVAAATSVDAMEPVLAQLLQLMRSARQNPTPPIIDQDKFQKLLFSDTYKGLIRRAFDSLPNRSFRSCRTLVSEKSSVILLSSISFGADGVPSSGAWRGAFPVKGCDLDTTLPNARFRPWWETWTWWAAGANSKCRSISRPTSAERRSLRLSEM